MSERSQAERDVVQAAIEWWTMLRPDGWTKTQHIGEPSVGLYDCFPEKHLAVLVGRLLRVRQKARIDWAKKRHQGSF